MYILCFLLRIQNKKVQKRKKSTRNSRYKYISIRYCPSQLQRNIELYNYAADYGTRFEWCNWPRLLGIFFQHSRYAFILNTIRAECAQITTIFSFVTIFIIFSLILYRIIIIRLCATNRRTDATLQSSIYV